MKLGNVGKTIRNVEKSGWAEFGHKLENQAN
jgi:hypothetical protein